MAAKKKATTKANGASSAAFETAVARAITSANALLTSLQALGLPVLTDEERLHTMGKLRAGEPKAMTSVFDTVDAFPTLFESLAGQDNGSDSNAVETAPARDALSRVQTLAPLLTALAAMQGLVSDAILAEGDAAKQLSVPAYAIGKAISVTNPRLRASLANAISFYGAPARKHAATTKRAATKAKRVAKAKTASA